ncbi:MBL fold metallo-hydrolase [Streptomyces sp. NPDC002265]|uniref:MBL fold metallo-hydrolase n=1 Tax=Streptomyces sp. NPDC002265 TaxID=3154415 RepID=UPI00331EE2F8
MTVTWEELGWERLAEGVGRCRLPVWDCTVGLITGAGSALLVDAGSSLAEGARLRGQAEALAGCRVRRLALTHPHFDHVFGAAAFAGATVLVAAGEGAPPAPPGAAVTGNGGGGGTGSGNERADAHGRGSAGGSAAGDGHGREGGRGTADRGGDFYGADRAGMCADAVRNGLGRRAAEEAADALVRPHRTVHGTLALEPAGGPRILLADVGPGHTARDLAVVVASDPVVVFCGDLVEESGEPQAGPDAVPSRWPAALDRLLELGGEDALYVPGHGAVVDAAFVRAQRDALARRFGVS